MLSRETVSHFDRQSRTLSLKEILLFCLLLATLLSLIRGYSYGTGNQIEHLPKIYRELDPSYCSKDFFTNASTSFGVRTYYTGLLVFLSSYVPLPIVFLALTLLSYFGSALVTYLATKDLIERSDFVAMLACVFVIARIPGVALTPGRLIHPLAILSLWAGIRGRAITCAALASLASVIHPLVGLATGAIGLATAGLSVFFFPGVDREHSNRTLASRLAVVLLGACILGAAALVLWVGKIPLLDTEQFIQILAHFRNPHHHVPSTWSIVNWGFRGCLLFAFAMSWKWWRDDLLQNKAVAYRVLIPVLIVLLLWCGGYVFVEVFPSRLWTTAQTFRFVFIVGWIASLVIAKTVARLLRQEAELGTACGFLILMGSGRVLWALVFLGHVGQILRSRMKNILPRNIINVGLGLLFLAGGVLLSGYGNVRQSVAVLTFMAITVWFSMLPARWYRSIIPILLLCVLIGGVTLNRYHRVPHIPGLSRLLDKMNPEVTLSDKRHPEDGVALYAREMTPETAVFLTPPMFGRFRLKARRAIIIDFKAFLRRDWAMLEWMKRITACYGKVKKAGFPAAREMDENYKRITKEKVLLLARQYGVSYAVLYRCTHCELPVLFEDECYKLVKIDFKTKGFI